MADNLALKLLVAGIIGAVVGAAAADRYRSPTGLMYGFNRPWTAGIRGPADSGRAPEELSRAPWTAPPPDWDWRWRQARPRPSPGPRVALCWRPYDEDWNFRSRGRWVRCPPGVGGRDRSDGRHIRRERSRPRVRKADRPQGDGQV
jgi:hypothetical protein